MRQIVFSGRDDEIPEGRGNRFDLKGVLRSAWKEMDVSLHLLPSAEDYITPRKAKRSIQDAFGDKARPGFNPTGKPAKLTKARTNDGFGTSRTGGVVAIETIRPPGPSPCSAGLERTGSCPEPDDGVPPLIEGDRDRAGLEVPLLASPTETLYDPRSGDLALQVTDLVIEPEPGEATPTRSNYFTIDWLQESRGAFWADCARHPFQAPALIFFVPYQRIMYEPERPLRGVRVQFHANFLCIETHHEEVGCNGVLFNDVYGIPTVALDGPHEREVGLLIGQVREELSEAGLAHAEIVLSYLKVLLIRATRLKRVQQPDSSAGPSSRRRPAILDDLRDLIEAHYHRLHAPADYARKLQVNPKTLGRLVKTHLHKTLTELIRERVLRDAKWDLLHTQKTVKQIAHGLGFADELYFSRLFKRATGYSPVFFREFETAIRSGEISSIP